MIDDENSGVRNGRSKLTENQVREIMAIRRVWECSYKKISEMYSVDEKCVYNICKGKSYKNITKGALDNG